MEKLGETSITCLSISEDANEIAYGCSNGLVRVYKPWEGCVVSIGTHMSRVNCISIIGNLVVSGGKDGEVKMWKDGQPLATVPDEHHQGNVKEIRLLSPTQVVTRCRNGSLRMWDVTSGKLLDKFDPPSGIETQATCMDFCVQLKILAMGKASGNMVFLHLYPFRFMQEIKPQFKEYGPNRSCRFSPEGKMLARGFDCGMVEILEMGSWDRIYRPFRAHDTWVKDIKFNESSSRMVTVGDKIVWWNLNLMTDIRSQSGHRFARRRKSSSNKDMFKYDLLFFLLTVVKFQFVRIFNWKWKFREKSWNVQFFGYAVYITCFWSVLRRRSRHESDKGVTSPQDSTSPSDSNKYSSGFV